MNINYNIPVTIFNYRESENSLYSFAKLKIFYFGETQDKRVFTEEFSEQLLASLPYVPVVGYYDEEAEDFIGHNAKIQNIYGVVPEETAIEFIWENGLQYAVCDIILYTGRLDKTGEIAQKIIGKQHSLELNPDNTTYKIKKDLNGKIQNIEFITGSLLGLSILGDSETPAFKGSSFFTDSAALFTEDIRSSLNNLYQQEMVQCSFKSQFSRHSYENRRKRAYQALSEMYRDVKFDIKEMTDNFIHYFEYFEDQNGEQHVCNRIYYKDNGEHVELIGGPEEVVVMYLTANEVEMVEVYETSDSLDYQTIGDLDLRPTETIANNAKRGLELRREHGRGGTSVGVARARDLSNRKNLSPDTVKRMFQYFARHEVDKQAKGWKSGEENYPSNGLIAWLLWGGDAGYSWAETRWNQIKRIREGQILDHEHVEVNYALEVENLDYPQTKDMNVSKPAPKKEQRTGSDKNKPGSAAGPGGGIKVSESVEKSLRNKVTEHNEKMKDKDKTNGTRATYGQVAAVYRRGAGAYSSSHRPGMTRGQWAMARVNAYLYLLENGKPKNSKYTTDYDLLPKDHPKSTRNLKADIMEKIKDEEVMEYPKDKDKDMEEVKEEEEKMEEVKEDEEEKMEEVKEEEEEEEKMEEVKEDEEEKMEEVKEDEEEKMEEVKEQEEEKMEEVKEDEEGEEIEEGSTKTKATQIESQKESSSTALNNSERTELEAFRRERKEVLISSFEDDLSSEFLIRLSKEIDNHSFDELEVTLSKEFTRLNRENKKSKPNAFIYKPEIKSAAKSEIDVVKELIQKYK